MLSTEKVHGFIAILKEELIQATGCTEPIAIAYCGALLRKTLGAVPTDIRAEVSGNILKTVKSVVVPNTGGLHGLPAAVAVGVIAGDPDAKLQVISHVTQVQKDETARYLQNTPIHISCIESPCTLDIILSGSTDTDTATVRIANNHTNVTHIEKNGEVLLDKPVGASAEDSLQDKSILNLQDIVTFANEVDISLLQPILEPQLRCNSAIAEAGLTGQWGAAIGKTLFETYGAENIRVEAAAYAAAGSDARMSGCEMPVVILSGSGNQGMTASLPVIRYAKHLGASQEQLYRALAVSDLVAVHQKTGIGRLSAYCGAISAGVGAGAGIAYLHGADAESISQTVVNAVAILSGTICDGAKASCAAKIYSSVSAGILGYEMCCRSKEFPAGDGIVGHDAESTIVNVGRLAREGMGITDHVILDIMTET